MDKEQTITIERIHFGADITCPFRDAVLPDPVEVIAERILRGTRPGSILLLHDGDGYDPGGDRMQTARALPRAIRGLRDRGYSFVTLATP